MSYSSAISQSFEKRQVVVVKYRLIAGEKGQKVDDLQRKRLFLGLVLSSCISVSLVLALIWIVPYYGFNALHPAVKWIAGILVFSGIFLVLWAGLGLSLKVSFGINIPLFHRVRGIAIRLFLPLMVLAGRALGISKNRVRSSFVQVNNELVLADGKKYRPDDILMLMPHCLQNSRCNIRLTYNVRNCKRCGRCSIAGLLELSDKYSIHLAVATGGTIARRIVVQRRPRLIIAVACQRDLASGIQDTYPLPVFGILNLRPNGPCLDTLVPMDHLEAAIRRFLQPEFVQEPGAPVLIFPHGSLS